jgi:hypothetical protein
VQDLFSRNRAFLASLSRNPFVIPSLLVGSTKTKMASAGDCERKEEMLRRSKILKDIAYDENRYRVSIGWSIMACAVFVFVFALIFFICGFM